jgi:hypothetical protein
MKFVQVLLIILLLSIPALAQEPAPCTPCEGKCLTQAQIDKLKKALDELDDLHRSPAIVEFQEPIVVIRDWDGRVYVNGGSDKPIPMRIRIGKSIDRSMAVTVDSRIWYRPRPEPPIFWLKIKAQAGLLALETVKTTSGDSQTFWDAGVSWDFMHFGSLNLAVFTGVRSAGIGPGIDLTKNFGAYVGYSFVYDGMKS